MTNHRDTENTEKKRREGEENGLTFSLPSSSVLSVSRWLTFRKYARIMRVSLIERLAYRGDFFFSTVLRFLPMLTTILLWRAVYAGTGDSDAQLAGYRYSEMIAYLLLVHVSRMFSS